MLTEQEYANQIEDRTTKRRNVNWQNEERERYEQENAYWRENRSRKPIPVAKWNIQKFNGDEEELPRFLSTITQYAIAENMPKGEVFRDRIHLFSGDAADFIRESCYAETWDELVVELTEFCLGTISDRELIQKIEQKKQQMENCLIFCTRMELAFKSLRSPLREQEEVDIMIKAMRPEIKRALAGAGITTVRELRTKAQKAERLLTNNEESRENDEKNSKKYGDEKYRREQNMREPRMVGRGLDRGCFRCGDPNHRKIECKAPGSATFCYKCKRLGYPFPMCKNCTGNGEGRSQ